jgi:putative membrane protein
MKNTVIFLASVLAAGPAFGQSLGEKTGIAPLLGITPSTADFVLEAAQSDMFELAASKMAAEKSDGAIKDFANQMVTDHTKTTEQLSSQAKEQKMSLPIDMGKSHQSKLDKLSKLNGGDFAKQYMDDQVAAHKDAVSLFQRYGKSGDNAPLKAWAVTTLPALQHHLDMAQNLDK